MRKTRRKLDVHKASNEEADKLLTAMNDAKLPPWLCEVVSDMLREDKASDDFPFLKFKKVLDSFGSVLHYSKCQKTKHN